MKRVVIEIDSTVSSDLAALVAHCNAVHTSTNGATTHGVLTIPRLLAMLAEDAAMVISRPGNWEGSNMSQVLSSHGYEV